MTTLTPTRSASAAAARPRARGLSWRWSHDSEFRLAVVLSALAVLVAVMVGVAPTLTPFTSLSLPLVLGSLLLSPRTLPWFTVLVMLLLAVCLSFQLTLTGKTVSAAVVQYLLCLVVLFYGVRRGRLGVAGVRGESMFVDLRDRLLGHGGIPTLPAPWSAESAVHAAGGTLFSGDFVVATRTRVDARDVLQLVLVDVSGKGEEAGTRALLLSGAFGGMLGALRPEEFLPAANAYLLRQGWDEGFATAVHLAVDLDTGDYEVRTAGHPPAVVRAGGEGWHTASGDGPVLGLIDGAGYGCASGRLAAGDAVLLYTDGMVETPSCDIDTGIADLMDAADDGAGIGPGTARRLVRGVGARDDDRAVVMVRREP